MSKNRTIIDIATALGISPSTVSRALNDHPRISNETKEKVKKLVFELDFTLNPMASSLRSNKTQTIGMIVPGISYYFHATVLTVVQNLLWKEGYQVIICQSNDSPEVEKELVNTLYASRVVGVIAATTLRTTDFSHYDILTRNQIPLVFYDRVPVNYYPAQIVKGDDYKGGFEATEHLIQLGCKSIAHISGPLTCNLYKDRYAGYIDALKKYKIPYRQDIVFFHELSMDNAVESIKKIFKMETKPDGIFTANDTSAIGALMVARELGIEVPKEFKIVGYSNDPRSSIISPGITTIDQHPDLIGQQLAITILDLIRGAETNLITEPIITPITLTIRESSKA
ncbi:LacI family DNA-binding transcriptional regulator [Solitalea koreensis]|uniref:Transcriptional regulator, LacI family n=1 Tax=Solitalea koreensis TaxID=543615 RepID=A0A521BYD6_9SPHI|nr:LacI family DNA-binding transcriptional regulator [Solitalea koreensis]SMO52197.1 transcriptional regulator, LacI family [Solitalea koreensis]